MTSTVCLPILPLVILTTLPLPTLTTPHNVSMPAVTTGSVAPSCCFPDQFQAVLTIAIQNNKPVYNFTKMAINYTAKKMVFLDYERNATVTPITNTLLRRTVIDYSAGVRKIFATESSGSCTSWSDTIVHMQCIPANGTFVNKQYMGFNSSSIQAYFYQRNYRQIGYTDFLTLAVQRQRMEGSSEDVCVPLFQIVSVFSNYSWSMPGVYTDFKPNISSDFNMTTGC